MTSTTTPKTSDSRDLAFGYPWTPYRIEWRPTYGIDDRETLTRQLDALERAGVKGWWYSAAAKGSYPLFKSEHLPYRDDADDDLYQWLTAESHRRGMAILSWEYLNTAPMLAAQKPEWQYKWFDHDGDDSDRREHQFVCYNSPYGDLLMKYCVEVVDHLGFDGIWFDGSTLLGVGTVKRRIACCCDYCKAKYKEQTGAALPEHIDVNDPAFRRYVNWRYADFMDYWARLSDYVHERCPDKLIAMNHFNRLAHAWEGGCPLWRTPMKAMISTEVGGFFNHHLLHHKYHRAINDNVPVEVWSYLRDAAAQRPEHRPHPDPSAAIHLCQQAATCGGYMSFGLGGRPEDTESTLTALSKALEPLQPYIGGEPVTCIGLVLSNATRDFRYDDPYIGWKHVHGAHNLLNALHLPSEVILDNMFDADTLDRYDAIVLPDVQCLSRATADALRDYVQRGGTLLALGETATHDLNGDAYDAPLLDDLFGIAGRHEQRLTAASLAVQSAQLTGTDDTAPGRAIDLPGAYMISGPCRPVEPRDDAEVLATTTYRPCPGGKRWSPQGLIPPDDPQHTGAAIVAREHGKGRAITMRHEVGFGYAEQPHRRTREVVRRLLADRVSPPLTTDAPPNVVIAPWRQDDRLAVHVLNMPDALLRLVNDSVDRSDLFWPEQPTPVARFNITVPGNWTGATSPTRGELPTERTGNGDDAALTITLDRLDDHDIIVLETT